MPAWGEVKSEWRRESDRLVPAAAGGPSSSAPAWCSTGSCPRSSAPSPTCPRARSSTGPADDLADWLDAAGRAPQGAGRLRHPDGPAGGHPPLGRRRGQGRASPTTTVRRLGDVPPHRPVSRPAPGWSPSCASSAGAPQAAEGGFAAGQPQYIFQLPLARRRGRPRIEDDLLAGHEPAVAPQHQEGREGGRGSPAGPPPTRSLQPCDASTTSTCTPPSATTSPRARWPTSRPCSGPCCAEDPDRIRALHSPSTRATWSPPRCWSRSAGTSGTPTAPPPPRSARCAGPTPCSGR